MKTTNLRIPDNVHKAMKESAEANRRSLNNEILYAFEYYIKRTGGLPFKVNSLDPKNKDTKKG